MQPWSYAQGSTIKIRSPLRHGPAKPTAAVFSASRVSCALFICGHWTTRGQETTSQVLSLADLQPTQLAEPVAKEMRTLRLMIGLRPSLQLASNINYNSSLLWVGSWVELSHTDPESWQPSICFSREHKTDAGNILCRVRTMVCLFSHSIPIKCIVRSVL